jgi:catechol 2,3-dioxygenase-like lactoylglutathione lyase family enzyme
MTAPRLSRIHHVAYRCNDAKETVEWYERVLGMTYTTAFAEDHVPSTGAYDPYMHVFLDCGGGNVLAFFELPEQPAMGRDPHTPAWVQHLAFEVEDEAALLAAKAHRGAGHRRAGADLARHLQVDLFLRSQRPPAGTGVQHRHARTVRRTEDAGPGHARGMEPTKRAPRHAAWLHAEPKDA